jgi:hypothetical protein
VRRELPRTELYPCRTEEGEVDRLNISIHTSIGYGILGRPVSATARAVAACSWFLAGGSKQSPSPDVSAQGEISEVPSISHLKPSPADVTRAAEIQRLAGLRRLRTRPTSGKRQARPNRQLADRDRFNAFDWPSCHVRQGLKNQDKATTSTRHITAHVSPARRRLRMMDAQTLSKSGRSPICKIVTVSVGSGRTRR